MKFERNRSVNVRTQANAVINIFRVEIGMWWVKGGLARLRNIGRVAATNTVQHVCVH